MHLESSGEEMSGNSRREQEQEQGHDDQLLDCEWFWGRARATYDLRRVSVEQRMEDERVQGHRATDLE